MRLVPFALASIVLAGFAIITQAASNEGIISFGGLDRLGYSIDGGGVGQVDSYTLNISSENLKNLKGETLSVIKITSADGRYDGVFDLGSVSVNVQGKPVPLEAVTPVEGRAGMQITLGSKIPASSNVEIKISNVKNPTSVGEFKFDAHVVGVGKPLRHYVGNWVLLFE
ncbi:DUF2808 domain-containing protein [Pseudomonas sp. SL4(2022)]|uniref:DUF2808 domain-containing protein n=1 Tax=Pseudomonas sp. SL4(2022) TaxID=2994661 RepID=UPI0022705CB2|nr:DUF2808 domain-containing protein [Pseudomonas sp. SL4(2022)]WAC45299.1 DUF2808 domain-containing protein [Pseudomonas sp. SL4(2022)]